MGPQKSDFNILVFTAAAISSAAANDNDVEGFKVKGMDVEITFHVPLDDGPTTPVPDEVRVEISEPAEAKLWGLTVSEAQIPDLTNTVHPSRRRGLDAQTTNDGLTCDLNVELMLPIPMDVYVPFREAVVELIRLDGRSTNKATVVVACRIEEFKNFYNLITIKKVRIERVKYGLLSSCSEGRRVEEDIDGGEVAEASETQIALWKDRRELQGRQLASADIFEMCITMAIETKFDFSSDKNEDTSDLCFEVDENAGTFQVSLPSPVTLLSSTVPPSSRHLLTEQATSPRCGHRTSSKRKAGTLFLPLWASICPLWAISETVLLMRRKRVGAHNHRSLPHMSIMPHTISPSG